MSLEASYEYCRRVARTRARNFYYSFVLLEREKRNAICAIYSFNRHCDDLSDEQTENRGQSPLSAVGTVQTVPGFLPREAIEVWRCELEAALAGHYGSNPLWPAFHDTVSRYKIPHEYFHEVINGVLSDLGPRRIQTFEELYRYCYQVASVVGLTVIHVFGFRGPEALPLAEKCGIAFQLTNILRDIREDAGRDRIYLPAEDLARFHVRPEDLTEGKRTDEFVELMDFELQRARRYYHESAPLVDMVDPHSRSSLWALIQIYSRLLDRIERSNYDVFSRRIALPAREKLGIILKAAVGQRG